jgi:uncharacterized membrane protein
MRVPRLVVALLAFSLVFAGVVVPVAGTSDGSRTTTTPENGTATPSIDRPAPHTIITINVTADGDARWIVSSRFVVETPNETAAFESLAESVSNGRTDLGYSVATFRQAANLSERSTGRQMTIENATWTSRVHNGTGTLSFRFTWTNFARVQEGQVVVDDAFSTRDGTWFPWLADGQRLVINPPPEFAPIDTPPDRGPINGALIWNGPRTFDPGYFSIVYVPSRPPRTTTTTPLTTTNPGPTRGTSPLFWIGVGLLVVTVGAGGYYYAVQQRRPRPTVEGTDDAAAESESRTAGPTGETDADATTDETGHRQQSASGSAEGSGASAVDVEGAQLTEDDDGGIDPELLSDEERVERLLERNGGRMKQGDIVKETGWSNAKVSQLLSSMAEEERINKLRIGRENLITLPDEDVTDFGE